MKATILACIFTLMMSIGGAYGVLKLDDATMKTKVEAIDRRYSDRFKFITKTLEAQQKSIYIFQLQVEKMTESYAERTEDSMDRLDLTMSKFADKVEALSNSIARLDERLKPIEARRSGENGT